MGSVRGQLFVLSQRSLREEGVEGNFVVFVDRAAARVTEDRFSRFPVFNPIVREIETDRLL